MENVALVLLLLLTPPQPAAKPQVFSAGIAVKSGAPIIRVRIKF